MDFPPLDSLTNGIARGHIGMAFSALNGEFDQVFRGVVTIRSAAVGNGVLCNLEQPDMDVITSEQNRTVTAARRRAPAGTKTIHIKADSNGSLGDELGMFPTDIRIDCTYDDGQITTWFSDDWWIDLLQRFKDRSLNLHIMPTAEALLHPIVLHELEMVRRLQTPWRLIGHCYLSDVGHPMLVNKIVFSPYDEIRIVTDERPCNGSAVKQSASLSLAELLDRVKTQQIADRTVYPLLTRAPAPTV